MGSRRPAATDAVCRALSGILTASLLAALLPASPAMAQEGTAAAAQLYQYRLLQTGTRLRGYPPEARTRRLEGTVTISLHISAEGVLTRQSVVRSSGHAILDEHALDLLARAVPLTEIPSALQNRPFVVRIAVAFVLPE